MIEIEIFKTLILDLCELVIFYNRDLKNGMTSNFVTNSDLVFSQYIEIYPDLNEVIVIDPNYGLNILFSGLTGNVLFPMFFFKNSYRKQIIKELKFFINKDVTFKEIQLFITKKATTTYNVKKGGLSERTLEILRFYISTFDKVIDNDVKKYLPFYKDYKAKYIDFTTSAIEKRFPLTQKYSTYYLMPKYHNFGLNMIMFRPDHEDTIDILLDDATTYPFGLLFDDQKKKKFSFYFTPFNRKLRHHFVEKICFFENLDLFQAQKTLIQLTNKTMNILEVFSDYKDGNFKNTAISYENEFICTQEFDDKIHDLDLIIHLFNTRKLPLDHEIHPISRHLITYRNKIVNFYGTTNYFIYIYDIKGRTLPRYINLFMDLIKNTFSNGYIIQSKRQLLISTFLFKEDFESRKEAFLEFVYSFKIEIEIFENLNLVPFSFFHLPSSNYFDTEENEWNFPSFEEQSIEELLNYQIRNLELERSMLQNENFKGRILSYLDNWTNEINYLKEQ